MSVVCVVVATCVFVLAAMWGVLGVLSVLGSLPRNRWFGVRSEQTLSSDETFRVANRVAGPGTIGAAIIAALSGLLTLAVDGNWSFLFGLAGLVAALIVVGLVSGYGMRAASWVPAEDGASGGGCSCCAGDAHESSAVATAKSTDAADTGGAAADCGTASCASCTLRGACSPDTANT